LFGSARKEHKANSGGAPDQTGGSASSSTKSDEPGACDADLRPSGTGRRGQSASRKSNGPKETIEQAS